MLLTVAGALLVATLTVVAARALHERRVLSAEVRTLRDEVRRLSERLDAAERKAECSDPAVDEVVVEAGADDAVSGGRDPGSARGSRTLH